MAADEPRRPLRSRLPIERIEPLRQGELDCLCGLYAAINAVRLLLSTERPLKRPEVARLFQRGVAYLTGCSELACTLLVGCDTKLWDALIDEILNEAARITGLTLDKTQPLRRRGKPAPAEVFALIEAAICRRQPVLVEIAGRIHHYTVVAGYTPIRLRLFDSGELVWLPRYEIPQDGSAAQPASAIEARSLTILTLGRP